MDEERRDDLIDKYGWDDGRIDKIEQRAAVLEIFEQADDPVLMAREVGDELGISSKEAQNILQRMETEGMVQRKRSVWWAVPAPCLEMEATSLLFDSDQDTPLSIDQIRDIVCRD